MELEEEDIQQDNIEEEEIFDDEQAAKDRRDRKKHCCRFQVNRRFRPPRQIFRTHLDIIITEDLNLVQNQLGGKFFFSSLNFYKRINNIEFVEGPTGFMELSLDSLTIKKLPFKILLQRLNNCGNSKGAQLAQKLEVVQQQFQDTLNQLRVKSKTSVEVEDLSDTMEESLSDKNTTASSKRFQVILTSFNWGEIMHNQYAIMYKYQILNNKDEVKLSHIYFSPLLIQLLGANQDLFKQYLLRRGFPEIFKVQNIASITDSFDTAALSEGGELSFSAARAMVKSNGLSSAIKTKQTNALSTGKYFDFWIQRYDCMFSNSNNNLINENQTLPGQQQILSTSLPGCLVSLDGIEINCQETLKRYIVEENEGNYIVWGQYFSIDFQIVQQIATMQGREQSVINLLNDDRVKSASNNAYYEQEKQFLEQYYEEELRNSQISFLQTSSGSCNNKVCSYRLLDNFSSSNPLFTNQI